MRIETITAFILIALGIACVIGTIVIANMVYGGIGAAVTQNPAPIVGTVFTVLSCTVTAVYIIRTDHEAND